MENLAPAEPQARARLTEDQVQDLVVQTVATQAESLLRTAYTHSLCVDDAHDAYQRAMEILLRRAHRLDPDTVHKWIHVVVKHEAMEVRRTRASAVAFEDIDFDRHESPDVSSPEDRALTVDRTTRAAEALRRLKPHELRTMWLKAMGHSYAEISALTGFSATKVNRSLAEGRKSFLERFEGIEAGTECARWQPVLSAIVDGEATASQLTDARPHLRNCPACRATLRGLHDAHRPLVAVLPVGLVGATAKLSGLIDRVLPAAATADPAVATGGAGLLGLGGAKLAGLLAAGAAATAGGGLVAVEHGAHRPDRASAAQQSAGRTTSAPPHGASVAPRPGPITATASTSAARTATPRTSPARSRRHTLVVRRRAETGRLEFAPRGAEPATARPAVGPATAAAVPTASRRLPAAAPRPVTTTAPTSSPIAVPTGSMTDSSTGEFAPQP
jgi:RNA polymerase sigma factor (sigma-70 family)